MNTPASINLSSNQVLIMSDLKWLKEKYLLALNEERRDFNMEAGAFRTSYECQRLAQNGIILVKVVGQMIKISPSAMGINLMEKYLS